MSLLEAVNRVLLTDCVADDVARTICTVLWTYDTYRPTHMQHGNKPINFFCTTPNNCLKLHEHINYHTWRYQRPARQTT